MQRPTQEQLVISERVDDLDNRLPAVKRDHYVAIWLNQLSPIVRECALRTYNSDLQNETITGQDLIFLLYRASDSTQFTKWAMELESYDAMQVYVAYNAFIHGAKFIQIGLTNKDDIHYYQQQDTNNAW